MSVLYEACVTSVAQARAAERAGADRLELCARIAVGGLTPGTDRLARVRAATNLPIRVMIRPHAGSYQYTRTELLLMGRAIATMHRAGSNGVVLGALTEAGRVDRPAMRLLIDAAEGLPVTFHRAFDQTADPLDALEELIELGADRILTSGGASTARRGAPMLRRLVHAARERIGIIACGRVRGSNVRELVRATGVREVHAHLVDPGAMRRIGEVIEKGE